MKKGKHMSTEQNQNQPAAPAVQLDLNDPKVLLGIISSLFTQQSEATAINKRLLEIELAKKEATERKDAEALATLTRQRNLTLDELKRKRVNDAAEIARCPHTDQRGGSLIYPIGNFPDHQLRGKCMRCPVFIEPEHFEYDFHGNATLIPEHPLYKKVLERDAQIYAGFVPLTSY
jgi:hypothetical protein